MQRGKFPLAGIACAAVMAGLGPAAHATQAKAPVHYRLAHQVPLPGNEGWDYLAFEQRGHRLFVSHGTHVVVLDTDTLTTVGEIADTPGVHGIALAPDLGRGYVSAGRSGAVVVFDLKTLARLKEIKVTGENPDCILYDPATHRVFTFNGRGRNATAIDARTDTVIGTLPLDAKPEFAVSDGRGRLYVNLEDRNSIARIDARALKVTAVWRVAGCEEPSGLALDRAGRRLFAVCGNRIMAAVDAASGRVLGRLPIAGGVDAAAFDPGQGLAFASCGEGVLTIAKVSASGALDLVQSLATQLNARTLALDEGMHRIFLVTADFGPPPPATPARPHPRGVIVPGSLRLLVVEPQGADAEIAPRQRGNP